VAGEYHLGYIARLAAANHLEFSELTGALDDTAAITIHSPRGWTQHEQERLAAAAGQPLARIARLYWPDPRVYLRDPEGFHRMLRPACHRCTAGRGIAGPVACYLPSHRTVCRRHRLWTGPTARTIDGQLDLSHLPGILRAHRRHRHLVRACDHLPWQPGDALREAIGAIRRAIAIGTWTPQQRQRLRQLAPATWQQALDGALAACPGPARRQPRPLSHRDRDLPRRRLARRADPPRWELWRAASTVICVLGLTRKLFRA
jgi:hypothetical protein